MLEVGYDIETHSMGTKLKTGLPEVTFKRHTDVEITDQTKNSKSLSNLTNSFTAAYFEGTEVC